MSGGEKSLTALAFISRSSNTVLLLLCFDEIDMFLDGWNVKGSQGVLSLRIKSPVYVVS